MALPEHLWEQVSNHIREGTLSLLNDTPLENPALRGELNFPHKGFYVGVMKDELQLREGFMDDKISNILHSADQCIGDLHQKIKDGVLSKEDFEQSKLFLTVIHDVLYIEDPMQWDENKDGVFMMWGDKYKGIYLPYEIRRMDCPKAEVLDRLATWVCHLPSTLWKLPESLIFRIICSSYPES